MYGFTCESEQQRIARVYRQNKRQRKHSLNRTAKRAKNNRNISLQLNIKTKICYSYILNIYWNCTSYKLCVAVIVVVVVGVLFLCIVRIVIIDIQDHFFNFWKNLRH